MKLVRFPAAIADPHQQENLIQRIGGGMHGFRQNGGGSGEQKYREFHHGDQQVGPECEQDDGNG